MFLHVFQTGLTILIYLFRTNVFKTKKACEKQASAEREGFEPPVPLRVHRFSRPAHSTTLTSLQDFRPFCEPGGGRTHDPQIKSLLLYQLSYRSSVFDWSFLKNDAKVRLFSLSPNIRVEKMQKNLYIIHFSLNLQSKET